MERHPPNSTPSEDWQAFVDGMSSFTKRDALAWAVGWPLLLLNVSLLVMAIAPLSVAKDSVRSDTEYFLAAGGLTIWLAFAVSLVATF